MSLEVLETRALNYGSRYKPRFATEVKLALILKSSPDDVHSTMVDEGIISISTVPCSTVFNLRGSSLGNAPYYTALVEYMGSVLEYTVAPTYIGGTVNTPLYEPVVRPKQLEGVHPVKFKSLGVRVLKFNINNYSFAPGLQYYKEFYVDVRGGEGASVVTALFKEFGLEVKAPPCGQVLNAFEKAVVKLGGPPLMQRILRGLVKE
ncbi:MAG: hypothetical protein QXT74_03690 [Candidatus Nezhaarchaeales archaeon]